MPDHSADKPTQQRIHMERMLARAERRSRQAAKLVDKWKSRLLDLDRTGVAARQARLWSEEHPLKAESEQRHSDPKQGCVLVVQVAPGVGDVDMEAGFRSGIPSDPRCTGASPQ